MLDHDRLFLLTGRSTSRHQSVYTGISLTDERHDVKEEEFWKAWIIASPVVRVNIVKHRVTMSHMSTSDGSKWEFDGIISKASDVQSDPARPRQNEVTLLKCIPPVDLVLPVFVGGNPALKPCKDAIIITLNVVKLIQFPDIKVNFDFSESHFGLKNPAVASQLRQLETLSPDAGTVLPVEVGAPSCGKKSVRCVLLLQEALGARKFLCKLYRSDSSAKLRPGEVLRRRACLPLRHKTFTSEFDIGTVEKILESNEVSAEGPNQGIVNQPTDGAAFPIECAACKRKFVAADFTPEQMRVIDLWAWYYPVQEERLLLERAVALFRQHPGLQGEFDAKRHSFHRDFNKTLGEMSDPRSDSSKNRFLQATANDPALRKFLSTTSCDYNNRYKWICELANKEQQRLNGHVVTCPTCGDGPVIIRDDS